MCNNLQFLLKNLEKLSANKIVLIFCACKSYKILYKSYYINWLTLLQLKLLSIQDWV